MKAKPSTGNIGASKGSAREEWYVRSNSDDEWFGPLSFWVADKQARVMTREGTPVNVLYAQVGTRLGERGGDPASSDRMFVAVMYENGKAFLRGRAAEFNKDKLPMD